MKNNTSYRTSARASIATLFVCWIAVAPSVSRGAEAPDANQWKKAKIEKLVANYFAKLPGYKDGDLITKSQTELLLDQMSKLGWVIKEEDREAIMDRVLDDGSFMVQQLTTPDGRRFLNKIRNFPGGIDRVERLSEMPQGKRDVHAMIYRVPDGYKWIEVLTMPRDGVRLDRYFDQSKYGRNMYKDTNRLYFADQLVEELASVVEIPRGSSTR